MIDKEIDRIIKANIKMAGFISLVKRMREAQEELDICSIGDYAFRQHCAAQLESEVDEFLKKFE